MAHVLARNIKFNRRDDYVGLLDELEDDDSICLKDNEVEEGRSQSYVAQNRKRHADGHARDACLASTIETVNLS